ncbi:MAG: DUF6057 family protein [Dysgonamonadaceae bacterium]|jgi:hypothetical protein|nr:DUF6057 family protein [Dysgonamonadaceae bacterium]
MARAKHKVPEKSVKAKLQPPVSLKKTEKKPLNATRRRWIYTVLFVVAACYFTLYYNWYFLKWAEEISLFLPTRLFFLQHLQTAGGLLTYTGTFLTQFFHHPLLGCLLFIGLLLFVQWLTNKAFRLPKRYFSLSFIPSILLLLSVTELGYELISVKLPGYLFVGNLGVTVCLACFYGYRKIKNKWLSLSFLVLLAVLAYPLFGFYALFTILLCVIHEFLSFLKDKHKWHLSVVATGMLLTGLIPYLFYAYVYSRIQLIGIYFPALPKWYLLQEEMYLWWPFICLFLSLMFFSVFASCRKDSDKVSPTAKFVVPGIFVASLFFLYFHSFRDENFRTELSMSQAVAVNDWQKVVTLGKERERLSSTPPTRLVTMYYHLALYKLGRAGDRLFSINHHTIPPTSVYPGLALMHQGGNPLYFHYGKINFCYRWCMENLVEYGMNVHQLKYMVKCSLMNGELALAQKYNQVLQQTFFYKSWAKKYQRYIDHYESFKEDSELKSIIPLLGYEDRLENDASQLDNYLLNSFAYVQGGSPEMLELSMQCNLVLDHKDEFLTRFLIYAQMQQYIPIHYQEAALLYARLNGEDISRLPLDKSIVDRFERMTILYRSYENRPDEEKMAILKPSFGDTFWYYDLFR